MFGVWVPARGRGGTDRRNGLKIRFPGTGVGVRVPPPVPDTMKEMANDQNPIVEKVAKALFQQAIKQARLDAGMLDFSMSDAIPVFRKLVGETDTGIAIVSAAYFDDCLKKLFSLNIDKSSRKIFEAIFDFNGPLGTFSSRINLAFGLSLISRKTHQRLKSIRKIRNEFAHSPYGISFNTEAIKNKIIGIDLNHKRFIDEIRKSKKIRRVTKPPSRLTMKEIFLIKSVLTLASMASEMIAFPVAKQNKVPVGAILGDYDNLPDNLKDIKLKAAECVFEIFRTSKK